jgi:hypothetical protein
MRQGSQPVSPSLWSPHCLARLNGSELKSTSVPDFRRTGRSLQFRRVKWYFTAALHPSPLFTSPWREANFSKAREMANDPVRGGNKTRRERPRAVTHGASLDSAGSLPPRCLCHAPRILAARHSEWETSLHGATKKLKNSSLTASTFSLSNFADFLAIDIVGA